MKRASDTSNAAKRQRCTLQSGPRKRSQRGASMILALFLFLVCALLASVVIAAATTVSGRHVQLAEMDQRYYNVASTVDLLKKELCEQSDNPVTITCEKTEERVTTTTYSSGSPSIATGEPSLKNVKVSIDGKELMKDSNGYLVPKESSAKLSFREQLALCAMFKQDISQNISGIDNQTIWDYSLFKNDSSNAPSGNSQIGSFKISHTAATVDAPGVSVPSPENLAIINNLKSYAKASLNADWSISLNVQSDETSTAEMYAINMACATDANTIERTEESTPVVGEDNNGNRTDTVTITTTRETEINWSLLRMEKA